MHIKKNINFKKLNSIVLGLICLFIYYNPIFSQNAAALDWVYQTYGYGQNLGHGIGSLTIDKDDYIYKSGGLSSGAIDLDPDPNNEYLISPDPDSQNGIGYVAKYGTNGELIWVIELELGPHLIKIDDNGNLYTSGHFFNDTDFDPSSNEHIIEPDAREMYIAKYDNEGNFLWVKTTQTQGSSQMFVEDLAICSQTNRITVSGVFTGEVDVNPDENQSNILSTEAFHVPHAYVVTYDLDGEFIWATDFYVFNVTSDSREYYVDYDENGNLFLCGQFADTFQLDNSEVMPPLVSFSNESSEHDIFLAKFNPNGDLEWVTALQGESRNNSRSLIVTNDYVLVTGHTNRDMTVYSVDREDSVYFDFHLRPRPFIAKFSNDNGNVQWAFNLYPSELSSGGAYYIGIDKNDGCYIAGRFNGTEPMDFNPDPNNQHLMTNNSGNQEAFLAKYTSDGDFAWAFSTPGGVFTEPKGLQVLSDDRVVLAGSYRGNVDVSGHGSGDSISSYFTQSINYHVFMAVYKQGMLSTQEVSTLENITLFPNPVTEKQTISLSGYKGKNVKITLYDLQGRSHGVVYDGKLNNQNKTLEFDVSHLSFGFYLYDVQLETERQTIRFLKY